MNQTVDSADYMIIYYKRTYAKNLCIPATLSVLQKASTKYIRSILHLKYNCFQCSKTMALKLVPIEYHNTRVYL